MEASLRALHRKAAWSRYNPSKSFSESVGLRRDFSRPFLHDLKFFLLVLDDAVRRNAFGQKNIRADCRVGADHRVAAHDGRSGIDANAVLNRWMAFFSAQGLPGRERPRDERHALIKFHARTDLGCLANDDAGPVIDEKV